MHEAWAVEFSPAALGDIEQLDRPLRRRILEKLRWLADRFDEVTPSLLHGDFREFYKLRVGDWRIAYTVHRGRRVIRAEYIDRRDQIYGRRKRA